MPNSIDLKKTLPKILKHNQFWVDIMDSFSEELNDVHAEIERKKIYYDIDNQDGFDDLADLARSFGYSPDLSVDSSIENLVYNIYSIVYRIIRKSTLDGYYYVFRSLPKSGEVYALLYRGKLIRSQKGLLNVSDDINSLVSEAGVEGLQPYNFPTEKDIATLFFEPFYFDNDPMFYFDSEPMLYFDSLEITSTTKHVSSEFQIDELIEDEGQEFTMTPLYLEYLWQAVNYNRRVVEVPHVGANITFIGSGHEITDHWYPNEGGYTIPKIKTSVITMNQFYESGIGAVRFIKMGSGSPALPRTGDPSIPLPTDVENILSVSRINPSEISEGGGWISYQTMLNTNKVDREVLGQGNNESLSLSGTLFRGNIARGSVNIRIPTQFDGTLTITDDQAGALLYESEDFGTLVMGSIDYETGDYEINSTSITEVVQQFTFDPLQNSISVGLDSKIPVEPESVILSWVLPELGRTGSTNDVPQPDSDNPEWALFEDDDLDALEDNYLVYGENPVSGKLENRLVLTFNEGVNASEVTLHYNQEVLYNVNGEITASYLVEGVTEIREVGLFDINDNLVAYATFPTFKSTSYFYHFGVQFVLPTTQPD